MPAIFAMGTKLQVGDGATPTEAFADIPLIRSITGPTNSRDLIDVTAMDTPGRFRNKIPGLKDWGVLSFEMLFDPGEELHTQMLDDYMNDVLRNYKLIYPDVGNTTLTFSGFVGNNPNSANFDAALTKTVEIAIMADPAPAWTTTP